MDDNLIYDWIGDYKIRTGTLPEIIDIANGLKISVSETQEAIKSLNRSGLMMINNDIYGFSPKKDDILKPEELSPGTVKRTVSTPYEPLSNTPFSKFIRFITERIAHNTQIIKFVLFTISFVMEAGVTIILFNDLPKHGLMQIYWTAGGVIILVYEVYSIINIKTPRKKGKIIDVISYIVCLAVLFLAVLSFNWLSIEGKSDIVNYQADLRQTKLETISQNKIAIRKYNEIVIKSTNIIEITAWRKEINKLTDIDNDLYSNINSAGTTNTISEPDSFSILSSHASDITHLEISKNSIEFFFLIGFWVILALIIYRSAPAGAEIKRKNKRGNV